MHQQRPERRSLLKSLGRWTHTKTAERLGQVSVVVLLGLFAWAVSRAYRPSQFEPSLAGDVTVLSVVGGSGPSRSGTPAWFELMVRLPSGQERRTVLREPLPPGEHLWAIYSVARNDNMVRLAPYVRCGMKKCPPGMKP